MASSYFILKVLRQKRERHARQNKAGLEGRHNIKENKSKVEIDTQKCRICLKNGNIPIFGDNSHSNISENVKTFAAIELDEEDNLPKNLCNDCYVLLQSAILFRKTAQESEEYLKQNFNKNDCIESGFQFSEPFDDNEDFEFSSVDVDGNTQKPYAPEGYISAETRLSSSGVVNTNFGVPSDNTVKIYSSKSSKINLTSSKLEIFDTSVRQTKKVRIQCSICNGLLTPQLYKRHLQRHRLASRLICEICGKMYRRDNLDVHVQGHSTNLPFQCKLCPYRGRFLICLQQHMRVHTGKKPYSCDKCPRQFTCRSNLNKHLLVHSKEKPFKCVECGKGFYTNSNLEAHISSYHLGIKYSCNICGNEFVTRKSLRKHELKIHKREKFQSGRPLYLQPEYNKS